MNIPRATMRLQFHSGFTFDDAAAIVPYLAELGISHVYASPITTARAGSMHGYDVVDPTKVNPELGGEAAFRRLVAALRSAGLGIIVDIVPNHMAVGGGDNPWWLDVLQHGRQSRFAHFFDIDWTPEDRVLRRKILVPFLGRPYGAALRDGEIVLAFNQDCGRYEARYFHHVFPIDPAHASDIAQHPSEAYDGRTVPGRMRLHGLLERQHFRLAWWRAANDAINWRRFFDVNELAALRMEDEEVFEAVHAKLFELFAEGLVDGVRIDHIDGLADPGTYCRRLRQRLDSLAPERPAESPSGRPYVIVEKILGANEQLPGDWDCDGTSGYDFMDQVARVLHDPNGAAPLGRLWASLSGRPAAFAAEEEESRREILQRSFASQLDALVQALLDFARSDLSTRDMAAPGLRRAVTEILVHMRVYRTYADIAHASPADHEQLARAVDAALQTCFRADRETVRSLALWLGGAAAPGDAKRRRIAIRKFQQLTAPLAAKAVEDTAFYRHGLLLSRLDVGFDPANFADGVGAFHRQAAARAALYPHAMVATATHDHKRGEDARARLAVLSEIPEEWATAVTAWLEAATPLFGSADGLRAPSCGDAAILFQMIVGAWPMDLAADDRHGCAAFAERLAGWQLKALREAKLATDWTVPNEAYETAAHDFLMRLFAPDWTARLAAFAHRIAPAGALNSLGQTVLKLTVPGVPDLYQGTEFWDFSLVDPDNRRAVDFAAHANALRTSRSMAAVVKTWRDGRVKQAVIKDVLAMRRGAPALFAEGEYLPLEVEGTAANHVVAFARRLGDRTAVIATSRLAAQWLKNDEIVPPQSSWGNTHISLPADMASRRYFDIFARDQRYEGRDLTVSRLFERLPVAVLMDTGG